MTVAGRFLIVILLSNKTKLFENRPSGNASLPDYFFLSSLRDMGTLGDSILQTPSLGTSPQTPSSLRAYSSLLSENSIKHPSKPHIPCGGSHKDLHARRIAQAKPLLRIIAVRVRENQEAVGRLLHPARTHQLLCVLAVDIHAVLLQSANRSPGIASVSQRADERTVVRRRDIHRHRVRLNQPEVLRCRPEIECLAVRENPLSVDELTL